MNYAHAAHSMAHRFFDEGADRMPSLDAIQAMQVEILLHPPLTAAQLPEEVWRMPGTEKLEGLAN